MLRAESLPCCKKYVSSLFFKIWINNIHYFYSTLSSKLGPFCREYERVYRVIMLGPFCRPHDDIQKLCCLKPKYSFGKYWRYKNSLMGFVYGVLWILGACGVFCLEISMFQEICGKQFFREAPKNFLWVCGVCVHGSPWWSFIAEVNMLHFSKDWWKFTQIHKHYTMALICTWYYNWQIINQPFMLALFQFPMWIL